ncbi:uncharacterized protein TNCV_1237371 [Trichonephila clavipes]|nr:uncharacterized protein TNCV_1237371 [Trichonephila clavipes]
MKITPLKVLRIDADKTLRLSVAFPVYRIVPVRGSKVFIGVDFETRFENALNMVSNSLCNMWACIILLKDSSKNALKEENDFRLQHFTHTPVAIDITTNSCRWFAVRGILYNGTLARNPRCSSRRRIDEFDISTPVAVDQRAANYLEEALRSFITMRSGCQSSRADVIFRRPLPVFRVVRCSLVHCFQTRITVELFHYTRAPIA